MKKDIETSMICILETIRDGAKTDETIRAEYRTAAYEKIDKTIELYKKGDLYYKEALKRALDPFEY